MKSPAFQFYPGDWLSSPHIMMMTPAEEGAYIRLLAVAWSQDDCGLPNDPKYLAAISRLGDQWCTNGALMACFVERNGRLYNDRLLIERDKQQKWSERSKSGAERRWKNSKNTNENGKIIVHDKSTNGAPLVPQCSSSSISSSIDPPLSPRGKRSNSISIFNEPRFNRFWAAYPRKVNKPAAIKAWNKLAPDDATLDAMGAGFKAQLASDAWTRDGGQYIPHPATWLNGRRWEDQVLAPSEEDDPPGCGYITMPDGHRIIDPGI